MSHEKVLNTRPLAHSFSQEKEHTSHYKRMVASNEETFKEIETARQLREKDFENRTEQLENFKRALESQVRKTRWNLDIRTKFHRNFVLRMMTSSQLVELQSQLKTGVDLQMSLERDNDSQKEELAVAKKRVEELEKEVKQLQGQRDTLQKDINSYIRAASEAKVRNFLWIFLEISQQL